MPAFKKNIHFAFDRGDRVWLVCDPAASGVIDGFVIKEGYIPRYIVAYPNGRSVHGHHELTLEEPNPYLPENNTEDE